MARRGQRSRKNLPTEPIELSIERMSHEGRGIADNDGKVAFVEGGLPGELVTARFLEKKSRYLISSL